MGPEPVARALIHLSADEARASGPAASAGAERDPIIAHEFAALRRRLLVVIAGLSGQGCADIAAVKAAMGLTDRAFGELWVACSCMGDHERSPLGTVRLSTTARRQLSEF
jgi:hypothetical protein